MTCTIGLLICTAFVSLIAPDTMKTKPKPNHSNEYRQDLRKFPSRRGRSLVESREVIKPRPSQLEPYMRLSLHTAPDVLNLRFC
jgi:hypothetical protein